MARRHYSGPDSARACSVGDLRAMAARRLPAFVFEYLEGGAEDEVSLARNRSVFDRYAFVPRALTGCARSDSSVRILGRPASMPLMVAPMGSLGLFARDGDACLARASVAAGVPFIQSTVSNATIEDIAAIPGIRHWFQLYVFRSPAMNERLIARARAAHCEALVVTVDASVFGNREWDRRNFRKPMRPTISATLEMLLHARWMREVFFRGLPELGNVAEFLPPGQQGVAAAAAWSRREVDPGIGWDLVARLRDLWPGKLVIKGLLSRADVLRARQMGADAVVLSNHGGRQLDGAVSPLQVLPEIAREIGGTMSVFIDSGIRRGTDAVKALALGADGVLIGRPAAYGLAAAGQAGAARALDILGEEIRRTLALLGVESLDALDANALVPAHALAIDGSSKVSLTAPNG